MTIKRINEDKSQNKTKPVSNKKKQELTKTSELPGSKPLKNQKHEQFCWNIVNGQNQTDAYLNAGYTDNKNARFSASNLATKGNVSERLEYLRWQVYASNQIEQERILEEHRRIAFASIEDFIEQDEEGKIDFKKIKNVSKIKFAAIDKFKVTTTIKKDSQGNDVTNSTVEINLNSKQKSLIELSELIGMKTDIEQIRTGLRTYGKDLYINPVTKDFELFSLEDVE